MLQNILEKFDKAERRLRKSFGRDRSTPAGRFAALVNYWLMDHAILRYLWTNFYEVAPGIYRSNQPTHGRFRRYKALGIKSVLNLRGEENYPHFHLAKESCETLELDMHIAKLWARNAPKRQRIQAVIEKLKTIQRPLLFHCKSGADRAGFVAAAYLLIFEGATVDEARKMLSLRFIHLKWTKTGVQDYILDVYEARSTVRSVDFETWIDTEYTAFIIQEGWDQKLPALETAERLQKRAEATLRKAEKAPK